MNIGGLVSALLPVFFVLALGYFAGKRNAFDSDQAAGLSKLALSFALPASLFVSMTDIPKDLLLQQGRLVLALILSHAGLFFRAFITEIMASKTRDASSICICTGTTCRGASSLMAAPILIASFSVVSKAFAPCCLRSDNSLCTSARVYR